jgi:hypothetical protein
MSRRARLACLAFALPAVAAFTVPVVAQDPAPAAAPSPTLRVTAPVRVSADRPGAPHVEPYLAAHPTDPDVLVGVSGVVPEDAENLLAIRVAVFRSGDGGETWSRTPLPACWLDPWIAFGAADHVFVSCMGAELGTLLLYRSTDAGKTWSEPVTVPVGDRRGVDRPVLAVDPGGAAPPRDASSPPDASDRQRVYLAYGQSYESPGLDEPVYAPFVSISRDSGRTFAEPEIVTHDSLVQQPFDAVVGSDGTFFVIYQDYQWHDFRRRPNHGLLTHRRTWISAWRDSDRAFRLPVLVLEQTRRQMPWSMAISPSDRFYVAGDGLWARGGATPEMLTEAGESNVFVMASGDRGQTWSEPVSVTPPLAGANFENPTVAVNRDGVVGVSWYDTRHDPAAECIDVYFTASTDFGETFLPAVRVTPETSCPRAVEAQKAVAERWSWGGDYSGLAATADGRFHVLWADSRAGVYQLWSAAVSLDPE